MCEYLNAHSQRKSDDGEPLIDYVVLKDVLPLVSPRVLRYVTPIFFIKVSSKNSGSVKLSEFEEFVREKVNVGKTVSSIVRFATNRSVLREPDLEKFIESKIPASLDPELHVFYVHASVRRILFLLDPLRGGKVSVSELALNREWPLSLDDFAKLYDTYLEMDSDENGLLSVAELYRYPNGLLTPGFVQKVFQEHQTFANEMDFKGYLDLVFVLQNPSKPTAIRYVWKLLDTRQSGKVGILEFGDFHESILSTLTRANNAMSVCKPIHLFHETLDVLQITDRKYVTLADLLKADTKAIASVMSMLCDAHALYLYDNREALLLHANYSVFSLQYL